MVSLWLNGRYYMVSFSAQDLWPMIYDDDNSINGLGLDDVQFFILLFLLALVP